MVNVGDDVDRVNVALRLFVAVELNRTVRRRLSDESRNLMGQSKELCPTRSENLHLTLQFLGDVSTAVLPDLGEAISHHVRSVCRFALSIEGLGIFPDAKRPRILWAGTVPSLALEHVALRVRRATAAWIGSDSTPFRPHITLGRFRARPLRPVIEGLLASNVDRRFGTMIVGHVSLVASQLSSAGACHRVLREYPLQEQS